MSTVQTSNFWYFMLFVSFWTCSSSARPVTEPHSHNHPRGSGKSRPSFWLCGSRRGPERGQNSTVPSCSVGDWWPALHTHYFHTGTVQTPDIVLMGPDCEAWKTSLQVCDNLGSLWHRGARRRQSLVSTPAQLCAGTNCIMGRAKVRLPEEMDYNNKKNLLKSKFLTCLRHSFRGLWVSVPFILPTSSFWGWGVGCVFPPPGMTRDSPKRFWLQQNSLKILSCVFLLTSRWHHEVTI